MLTAVLTTPLTTVPAGYKVNVQVTVSNSAGNAVTIKQIIPQIKSTPISFLEDKSSWIASTVNTTTVPQVPAGGSQAYLMEVVFHGTNQLGTYDGPTYQTSDVSCIIYAADGETFSPTPLTITVKQPFTEGQV